MVKIHQEIDSKTLCDAVVAGMQENKAKDITVLDLRKVKGSVTDFFVICSGDSSTQVEGIADSVVRFTRKELKEKPWHIEGKNNAEWILMDYVNVVAHVFYKDVRSFYDLEDLWADAVRTDIESLDKI
jgi:ribosome-associated protein